MIYCFICNKKLKKITTDAFICKKCLNKNWRKCYLCRKSNIGKDKPYYTVKCDKCINKGIKKSDIGILKKIYYTIVNMRSIRRRKINCFLCNNVIKTRQSVKLCSFCLKLKQYITDNGINSIKNFLEKPNNLPQYY